MKRAERHFFEFGSFRVDVEERRLLRENVPVALASRDFDILLALVQSAGQTVEKNDLIERVWENTFVEEGNLNRHVSTLRRVLGDDPREQRLIKTIPKRGYRFTAQVREILERDEQVAVQTTSRSKLVIREETTEVFWSTTRLFLAGAFVLALVAVGWFGLSNIAVSGHSGEDARRGEAFDLYTRGRALWQTRDVHDLHNATQLLERAVEIDPGLAVAHAALADAYAFDYANWKKAEASAREAIRLDPSLGQPHATLGFTKMFWEWRLADAEAELRNAVELDPNYATGLQWYSLNLASQGRVDAAVAEMENAIALEPRSVPIRTDYCRVLYFDMRLEMAREQCMQVLGMAPGSLAARELLFQIAMTAGDHREALERFANLLELSKSDTLRSQAAKIRQAYETGGTAWFRTALIHLYTNIDPSSYKLARVLAEAGERDAALASLAEAVRKRDFDMVYYAPDPAFGASVNSVRVHGVEGRPR